MLTYFAIALVFWCFDGTICYAVQIKFNARFSFWCSILWPITAPIAVFESWRLTKDFPDNPQSATRPEGE